jgi:two-component system nitrogen regulation sensor histidine kinase GlnL
MISLDAIINSLEESIILFDKASTIIYLNKSAEELFRKSSRDIEGKKLSQILNGEKSIPSLIRKTITEGRSFRGKSIKMDVGRTISVDFNLSPFFVNSKIEGAVLSISENFNIVEDEDHDFDSSIYLIGSIAHEIKNPLGGIKGAAQLLRKRVENPEEDEYVDLIIRETDRLNAILQDYLTICKKPSLSPVNIHEIMEKALSIMNIPLKRSGITLRRLYDPSLPQVQGDEAKLLQVFLNVVKNAIEAVGTGKDRVIEVSTYPSRESIRREQGKIRRWSVISIRDSGKGMSDEELRKIFIPFYTKKKHGTGLGLALSRKIVKDHGGLIRVKSREGEGTTISIYIPFDHK